MSTTVATQQPVLTAKQQHEKEAKYLLNPADFRKKVLRPLVVETRKIVHAAIDVGVAKHDVSTTEDGKAVAKLASEQLHKLVSEHLKRLLNLANFHRKVYSLSSAKAQRILKGQSSKRVNKPARTLAHYDPKFVDFLREAADSHENLKFFKASSVFDPNSRLSGMSTQIMISQFLLCYAAVHQRYNSDNRQFIQPNEQMIKYLDEGLKSTLARQAVKMPELSHKYPGQLRFPYIQTLISFYRRPPTSDEERSAVRKLSADVEVISTLNRENDVLSAARGRIWADLRQNLPPKVKPVSSKMTKSKATAKRVKKQVESAAATASESL